MWKRKRRGGRRGAKGIDLLGEWAFRWQGIEEGRKRLRMKGGRRIPLISLRTRAIILVGAVRLLEESDGEGLEREGGLGRMEASSLAERSQEAWAKLREVGAELEWWRGSGREWSNWWGEREGEEFGESGLGIEDLWWEVLSWGMKRFWGEWVGEEGEGGEREGDDLDVDWGRRKKSCLGEELSEPEYGESLIESEFLSEGRAYKGLNSGLDK
jgi:hypothetical protein